MGKDEKVKMKASAEGVELELSGEGSQRLTASFVDALSPFTEILGALGDEVRRLRIHREMTAMETLKKAKQIRDERGIDSGPVSPKLLAPWLEGASLEDDGEQNISELWAALLAESPKSFSSEYAIFIEILRKIGRKEAQALEEFIPHHGRSGVQGFSGELDGIYREIIDRHIEKIKHYLEESRGDIEKLSTEIFSPFNMRENKSHTYPVRACSMYASTSDKFGRSCFTSSDFLKQHRDALPVLEHAGLVSLRQIFFSDEQEEVGGYFILYELTHLGQKLLRIIHPVYTEGRVISTDADGKETVIYRKIRQ